MPNWDRSWCGDVWKTIHYLRKAHKNLRVFVLNCDSGLGLISHNDLNLKDLQEYSLEDIKNLNY